MTTSEEVPAPLSVGGAVCVVGGGLAGCTNKSQIELPLKGRGFQVEDIAKSDVDMVAEVQLRYSMEILELLMAKLYQRNPQQWQRSGFQSLNGAVNRLSTVTNKN